MGTQSLKPLRTSEVATAVSVHPNTVRLYEELGFLPPIPRAANGYRQFKPIHIDHMRLANLMIHFTWLGGEIRKKAQSVVRTAANGSLADALTQAKALQARIQSEQTQAQAASDALENWASQETQILQDKRKSLHIGAVAKLLNITSDKLRHWERDGLIQVPRDSSNGYRLYGSTEIGRLRVIRSLRSARYSTMSILRMLLALDQGQTEELGLILDTPRPDEDAVYATDKWITTLNSLQTSAADMIALLIEMQSEEAA